MSTSARFLGIPSALFCLWCATPSAATTPIQSAVGLTAGIEFYEGNIQDYDTQVDQQDAALETLSVSVSASLAYGDAYDTTSGHVLASWANASSGSIHEEVSVNYVDTYPWTSMSTGVSGAAPPAHWRLGSPDWVYQFIPDVDGQFHMSYSSSYVDTQHFISDSSLVWLFVFQGPNGEQSAGFTATGSGQISFPFTANSACIVRLYCEGTYMGGSGIQWYTRKQISCSWSIDSASDPSLVEVNDALIAAAAMLRQNVPNPFNPMTTIKYDLPEAGLCAS